MPVKKWEYRIYSIDPTTFPDYLGPHAALNALGGEGWEAISVFDEKHGGLGVIFKRPLTEN
jgi:hypothetical protein